MTDISKEWCINMAKKEAGYDIGAGRLAMDPNIKDTIMTITQADRDAAENSYKGFLASIRGEEDGQTLAAAFAAHRLATIEQCAAIASEEIVEIFEDTPGETDIICNSVVRNIASNIRALAQEKTND